MCYILLLSTTSDADLTVHNNTLVRYSKELPAIAEVGELKHQNRWYIGSRSGCSCSFRHLHSIELGFADSVDWYPEEAEDVEATLQVIRLIRDLVASGHGVDCIDAWDHREMLPAAKCEIDVSLSSVRDGEFRFFENHHFIFRAS